MSGVQVVIKYGLIIRPHPTLMTDIWITFVTEVPLLTLRLRLPFLDLLLLLAMTLMEETQMHGCLMT